MKSETKKAISSFGITAILVIAVFAMFTTVASAADIYVPEGGNQTIQQAVDNATAGDTIIVRDAYTGTKENIVVNKAHLTIRSENGSALTIVNASNPSGYVFEVTASYVNISGFTVKDGHSGIYLGNNVNHCNISDNNATNNTADGFRLDTSSHDNTLTNNTANSNTEAGILCWTSSDNILTNNTANSNDYGFWLYNSSNNNTLTNNTANLNNKDGFLLQDSSNNNTLANNTANLNMWYGIRLLDSSNNIFTNNTANSNSYYGIWLKDSSNNTLTNNNAYNNSRYGIYLDHSGNNILTNNTAQENNRLDLHIRASSDLECNNKIENTTGSGNRPIGYYNDSAVSLADSTFSELILCNADHSDINNVTIEGSATKKNNGVILVRTDFSTLSNINSSNNYEGIWLYSSNNNTLTNNTANENNNLGIYLHIWSNYNTLTNNTAFNNSHSGIMLSSSEYNTVDGNNASANTVVGIFLYQANHTIITNNTASNNTGWEFASDQNSHDNNIEDLLISSYPTTISFTYDQGIGIKGVTTPEPDPEGKVNIGKYVNATNVTADSWLFLNVSYSDDDVPAGGQESALRMWQYNGASWAQVPGTNGVNTTGNYVYANLTEFSIFAPLGDDPAVVTIPTATGSGNVTITTSSGYFCNETAALGAAEFPDLPDSAVTFPHGFFNVTICGLNDQDDPENVTINFTFPTAIPMNAEFWKYNSSNGTWYQYPFGSNDGDNVISITITDNNATGDHNPALGTINDPNGVGWRTGEGAVAVPAISPIGMLALIGILSVVAVTALKRRK